MLTQTLTLYPYNVLEFAFSAVAGFGALLIWNLPRYRALAVFFIFQSVLMLLNNWEELRSDHHYWLITPVFTLAKGPLLYLFIRSMVNESKLPRLKLYSHFLPMMMALPVTIVPQLVVIFGTVSQLIYLAASFRLLNRYHRAARSFRADADALELGWVVKVFGLFTAQILIGLVRLNLQPLLPTSTGAIWFTFDIAFLCGLCCFMLFKVLRQPVLYDDMLVYEKISKQLPDENKQRESAEAKSVFAGIEALILSKHLHRQPGLSVEDIANETGLQMKDVSWAINLGSQQNFNEYINRLRINEVKQIIAAGQTASKSLLELAFDAGFNSKSTFNTVFKREVGMTPTQFVKNNSHS